MSKLLAYTTVILILTAAYVAWVMASRWQERRNAEQAAKQAEIEQDKTTIDMLGGDKLRIIQFSAQPKIVKPGERALVCYGVTNAESVRIEPHIDDITPSLSRCLEVFPKRTIEYKITAQDSHGHTVTKSLMLKVQ